MPIFAHERTGNLQCFMQRGMLCNPESVHCVRRMKMAVPSGLSCKGYGIAIFVFVAGVSL